MFLGLAIGTTGYCGMDLRKSSLLLSGYMLLRLGYSDDSFCFCSVKKSWTTICNCSKVQSSRSSPILSLSLRN